MTLIASTPIKPDKASGILKHFWKLVRDYVEPQVLPLLEDHPWILKERAPRNIVSTEHLPFIHAALRKDALDLVEHGIKHGAPLEDRCPLGMTALHALLNERATLVHSHIEAYKNLIETRYDKLIKVALSFGSRCDGLNHAGEPLWYAAMHAPMPLFEKLIEKGSPLDFMDNEGWSGLSLAICQAPLDKVKLLVDKGANANLFELRAMAHAPLLCAFHRQAPEIADLLVANGARKDVKDGFGRTFLHHAQSPQAVLWLLEHGLDLEAKDVFGRTPLLHLLDRITQKPAQDFPIESMQNVAKAMILADANIETRDRQDTSLSARNVIVSHPDRMLDLNNMLRSFEAREMAKQTIAELTGTQLVTRAP